MSVLSSVGNIARYLGMGALPIFVKKYIDKNRYRTPKGPAKVLPASYFFPIELLAATTADKPSNEVFVAWMDVPGGHKWLHYFDTYRDLLAPLRERPIRMLEIGVYRGASLKLWRKYLHPASAIIGIDIDESCRRFDCPAENVHVRIGSQADSVFLENVTREFGPFDVILDDGSHVCSHMVASFGHLYIQALKDDGIYIAEDTHTNFWPKFRDQRYSFIDLCKDLADTMHSHYAIQAGESEYRVGSEKRTLSLKVPLIAAQIKEISFRDSIVVVRKKPVSRLPGSQHN